MSLMGRDYQFELQGSGRWLSEGRFKRALRPLYFAQPPFKPPLSAEPNDRFVPVSVNSPASGNRPQPLHRRLRRWAHDGKIVGQQ